MNKIINASDVKPNFEKVKVEWSRLLSQYYDDKGEIKKQFLIDVFCPFCNQKYFKDEFSISGFRHVTCEDCKTVYVTPRLNNKCIDKLYSADYYSEMYIKSMIPVFEKRKKLIGESKYNYIIKNYNNIGSVLDIGCGIGEVIDVFKDHNWDCHAIEFNPGAVKWLRSKDINVSTTHFDDFKINSQFDVIMAWGVVEHVLNPQVFLKKVYSLLKPGGVFISEVPNGSSLLVDYVRKTKKDPLRIIMGEQHIVLYSIDAYKQLHLKAGLNEVHVQTNGLDYSTIFNINNVNVPDSTTRELQDLNDENLYGDLTRGIWKK